MFFCFCFRILTFFFGGKNCFQGVKTSQIENVELIHYGEQKSQPYSHVGVSPLFSIASKCIFFSFDLADPLEFETLLLSPSFEILAVDSYIGFCDGKVHISYRI